MVIPPRSGLVGETVFPGMVTDSGDLVILAIQRKGEDLRSGETTLAVGDTLLLQGTWAALDENLDDPDVLVVDAPELVRRQAVPLGPARRGDRRPRRDGRPAGDRPRPRSSPACWPPGRWSCCGWSDAEGAYRAISWTTVVLVAGMIPLSTAMTQTGAADLSPTRSSASSAAPGPTPCSPACSSITATLGQLISNMATALIVIPIAVAAALELGVSAQPVLMSRHGGRRRRRS